MIEGRLVFSQAAKWPALSAFFRLPPELRPSVVSTSEEDAGEHIEPSDDIHQMLGWRSGFFLNGPGVSYDISTSHPEWIICSCFMETRAKLAEAFLAHMADAQPLFGYLCSPEEKEKRNRIKNNVGVNYVESWVGRDINKYIPGIYWLTLLPEALAVKHRVSISKLADIALRHFVLDGTQHLFRFYDRPENWCDTDAVLDLCSSTPGIFNIEWVKSCLVGKDTLLAYTEATRAWR